VRVAERNRRGKEWGGGQTQSIEGIASTAARRKKGEVRGWGRTRQSENAEGEKRVLECSRERFIKKEPRTAEGKKGGAEGGGGND